MSVWDGMPYIPHTVRSVLGQTFADFEFVINDNGSTDGTREYLTEIAKSDSRVRLIFSDSNLGHSGGLNRALAECRGEWIARIDADDVAHETRLQRQLDFVGQYPELRVASCLAHYIDASGKRIAKTYHDLKTPADFKRYMDEGEAIGLLHPGAFMHAVTIRSVGGYREFFGAANDIDLWARVAESGGLILVQQELLMEYRIHPDQISAAKFTEARMKYEWSRECSRARRSGLAEPSWAQFVTSWDSVSLPTKLNRWRKLHSKRLYRDAGVRFACGHRTSAVWRFICAAALQPSYAVKRITGQKT